MQAEGSAKTRSGRTLLHHVYIPTFIEEFGSRGHKDREDAGTSRSMGTIASKPHAALPLVGGNWPRRVSVSPVTFYEGPLRASACLGPKEGCPPPDSFQIVISQVLMCAWNWGL